MQKMSHQCARRLRVVARVFLCGRLLAQFKRVHPKVFLIQSPRLNLCDSFTRFITRIILTVQKSYTLIFYT